MSNIVLLVSLSALSTYYCTKLCSTSITSTTKNAIRDRESLIEAINRNESKLATEDKNGRRMGTIHSAEEFHNLSQSLKSYNDRIIETQEWTKTCSLVSDSKGTNALLFPLLIYDANSVLIFGVQNIVFSKCEGKLLGILSQKERQKRNDISLYNFI